MDIPVVSGVNLFLFGLFGWSPQDFLDTVFNSIQNASNAAKQSLIEFISKTNEMTNGMFQSEFESGVLQLDNELNRALSIAYDKLEIYVTRNIFTVPRDLLENGWIRTPLQEGVDFTNPKEAHSIAARLSESQRQLDTKRKLLALRKQELHLLQKQEEQLNVLLKQIPAFDESQPQRLDQLASELKDLEVIPAPRPPDERDQFNDLVMTTPVNK